MYILHFQQTNVIFFNTRLGFWLTNSTVKLPLFNVTIKTNFYHYKFLGRHVLFSTLVIINQNVFECIFYTFFFTH